MESETEDHKNVSLIGIGKEEPELPASKYNREFIINILLMLAVVVSATSSGMAMGYPAVLLPQLKSNESILYADEEMGSWIASIVTGSMPIGSLISGFMIDKIGRRLTMHLQCGVVILGWVLAGVAQNHATMLTGRFVSGVASGLGMVAGQVYNAEVSSPKARGILSSAPFVSYAVGILLVYALGAVCKWRLVAGLSTIPPFIAIAIIFFYPESHVWLIRKGKVKKGRAACVWFRANKIEKADKEVEDLIARFSNEKLEKYNWRCIFEPYCLKPLIISIIFNLLQTFSGVYVVVFYAADIIAEMGTQQLEVSDMLIAVLTALIRMIFSFVSCVLLHYMSRRGLALLSAVTTSLFSFILGICLYLGVSSYFMPICLFLYVAANTVGLLVLPGVMIGELFPARIRGVAGGLSYTLFSISIFAVAKIYPFLKRNLRVYGLFSLFGVSSLLLCLWIYFTLPETRNKTLHEVEDYFMEESLLWKNRNKKRKEDATMRMP